MMRSDLDTASTRLGSGHRGHLCGNQRFAAMRPTSEKERGDGRRRYGRPTKPRSASTTLPGASSARK